VLKYTRYVKLIKYIMRKRILESDRYWTKIEVHAKKISDIKYLTSKLVFKNLDWNIKNFQEELLSKWSILWSILRWMIREVNELYSDKKNKNKEISIETQNNWKFLLENEIRMTDLISDIELWMKKEQLIGKYWDDFFLDLIRLFRCYTEYDKEIESFFNNDIELNFQKWKKLDSENWIYDNMKNILFKYLDKKYSDKKWVKISECTKTELNDITFWQY
jgi:hypothetical protein